MGIMKNINQAEVLKLKDQVAYHSGQIVQYASDGCIPVIMRSLR